MVEAVELALIVQSDLDPVIFYLFDFVSVDVFGKGPVDLDFEFVWLD